MVSIAMPLIVIYTFGIYRDGTGNKKFDKPQENWQIIDNRELKKEQKDLNEYMRRLADIPLSSSLVVNRQQLIFWGFWENENTVKFISTEGRHYTPGAFLRLPEIIKNKMSPNIEVNLQFPY